jgi:hypothetical protein
MAKAKKSKAKKSKAKKSKTKKTKTKKAVKRVAAASARKAKKSKAKKVSAKRAPPKKAAKKSTPPAKKAAPKKKQTMGEGDYQASRKFLAEEAKFVKRHKAEIPQMGKDAEAAIDGPEGDALRAAEEEAKSHSKAPGNES